MSTAATHHAVDPAAARRHLETTADIVTVHDIMAEALSTLRGIYLRAAARAEEGSSDHVWWRAQAQAVRQFRISVDPRDRQAMLAALDRARTEIDRVGVSELRHFAGPGSTARTRPVGDVR